MQYQVPQFIEIEDKIFGPLTFKQFLYVAGGAALGFICWALLPKILALLIGTPVVAFFMAAAFYKVNGRPFLMFIEGVVKYMFSSKQYLWRKSEKKPIKREEKKIEEMPVVLPRLSQDKLSELSNSLDIQEKFGPR